MAKHRSKLRGFNFEVIYEPGYKTPADYGSHYHPPARVYSEEEQASLGIKNKEDDAEVIVNRVNKLTDAVTVPILQRYTKKDKELVQLREDMEKGKLRKELGKYKECFAELS